MLNTIDSGLKRIFTITGAYLLAVLVSDIVAVLMYFLPQLGLLNFIKLGAWFALVTGFIFILILGTGPALIFIVSCEKYGYPNRWGYIFSGAVVALLAHGLLFFFQPALYSFMQIWPLVVASVFGGAAGAFTFWKIAVAPLNRHVSKQISAQAF